MSRPLGGYIGYDAEPATTASPGIWTLREAELYRRKAQWPLPSDPFFSDVVLLLHMDGANNSTTFTDSSQSSHTATDVDDAKISTSQSKFGGASALFDGSGDMVTFADSNDFHFGSDDFTIEAWIRLAAHPGNYAGVYVSAIISQDDGSSATSSYGWNFSVEGSASQTLGLTLTSDTAARTSITGTANFALNTWYHVAAVRDGNTIYLYKDGVLLNSGGTAFTGTLQNSTTTLKVGALNFDSVYKFWFAGNIDEVRVTNGVARYPGGTSFTPPGDPFPSS